MRTIMLVAVGLTLAVLVWRLTPAPLRTAATALFTLVWLGVSIWNLNTGLSHGYTLAQEIPIHIPLFGIPVAVAWWLWWSARRQV